MQDIDSTRKTAVINNELLRQSVDITVLQETRQADSGTLKENDYVFFWKEKHSDEPREHSVGFAVKNSLLSTVEPDGEGSERLLTLRLNTTTSPITLVSVYAPTLTSPPETKDLIYEKLSSVIRNISDKEQLVLLGDFNARVGADNDSWSSCLGCNQTNLTVHGNRAFRASTSATCRNPSSLRSLQKPLSRNWSSYKKGTLCKPTLEGISQAIDNLASGKAPCNDGIPPDLLKQCKSSLLSPLHKVLCECWEYGTFVPQDMRDAKIFTLYKNKGERSDCNNYRGISLLSIVGKVFARVISAATLKYSPEIEKHFIFGDKKKNDPYYTQTYKKKIAQK
ncbi:uncharacterized protein [Magallana gigas]|uniref:uncharacterized protein n=1 Tax=Magallana gigas TaxID=29159 RepID=UPI0033421603